MNLVKLLGAVALFTASTTAYRTRQAGNQTSPFGNQSLPIVDLGYEIYQASNFNETGRFYNFSNIRFGAKPIRFGLPEVPEVNRTLINDGNVGRMCPQSGPAWFAKGQQWLTSLVLGTACDGCDTPFVPMGASWNLPLPVPDPREQEDCLFLDLFVPESVLKSAGKGKGAAILVWFYGGGYTFGRKEYNPSGLLAASGKGDFNSSDVIYISANYRLGAMGFTSGPTFQGEGGVPNLGLLDQRLALEWIQKYIHQFGGDKDRVTLFGESSGGGSILHQITAYGGKKGPVPFKRAIPQSGGWMPVTSPLQQDDIYQALLSLTNSSSLADLRKVSEADFIRANALLVGYNTTYSNFLYNPVVDGDFSPQLPGQLFAEGAFDKNVEVMYSLVAHEGAFFTAPYLNSTAAIRQNMINIFPYISQKTLDYITNTLYPAVFNGSYGYTNEYDRAALVVAESIITCNTKYMANGYKNNLYSYLFAMPPAYHGFDNLYTYYDGGAWSTEDVTLVMNRTVAIAVQELITSFAKTGVPEAQGVGQIKKYGAEGWMLKLNSTGFEEVKDVTSSARCAWWQKALY